MAYARPRTEQGRLAAWIGHLLLQHVEKHPCGEVMVGTAYLLERNSDRVRDPDVSFISNARLPEANRGVSYPEMGPDLAVEIVAPGHKAGDILKEVKEFLSAGSRLVWVVYPRRRQVAIFRPDHSFTRLGLSDRLTGETVLPGFDCSLATFFLPLMSTGPVVPGSPSSST
ncbi:MAG TPA: Uma2 family endonuclease [Candidatus Xenobia bacterium]